MDPEQLARLQEMLEYRFEDVSLLTRALTHRSWANERAHDAKDNEVLEFLGDAVLGLVVSDLLCTQHPDLSEGQMSKLKSFLVSADTLGRLADEFGLGAYILLGRGEEKTAGRAKNSILANAFEALIGALYLDGGLEQAQDFVLEQVEPLVGHFDEGVEPLRDFKSTLQERVQARGLALPTYDVVEEEGPDHDKVFHVRVSVGDRWQALGHGRTKKRAEQRAARQVLDQLRQEADEAADGSVLSP